MFKITPYKSEIIAVVEIAHTIVGAGNDISKFFTTLNRTALSHIYVIVFALTEDGTNKAVIHMNGQLKH